MNDLEKAIQSFERSLNADLNKYSEEEVDWIKNGQIQKFEYTIELLWKTIKEFFKIKYDADVNFALENIKEFFRKGYVDEDGYNILYDAVKSRNLLSHVYKLEIFDLIYPSLAKYLKEIKNAYDGLKSNPL